MSHRWLAVLMMVLAVPLILGWVPPNRFYGVRTRRTLSDDALWFAANRVGGWVVLTGGAVWLAVLCLRTP